MCGIFGITGAKDNAATLVFDGLQKLDYRGYDSWGIVVKAAGGKLITAKHIGKLPSSPPDLPASPIGLGHTRWATHGGVTDANAHPFLDCHSQLALVHNGIIENYLDLKRQLKTKHTFTSETDTEILLHLIEEYHQDLPLVDAVRKAFAESQGLNAIIVIDATTDTLVAAKTGSPLVIGLGKSQNFIASDLWSLLHHTRAVYFLADGQLAILTPKEVILQDVTTGKNLALKPQIIDWQEETSSKGDFPHFMIKEIGEQPQVLLNILSEKTADVTKLSQLIKASRGAFLTGCGTAAYAAMAGEYFFSRIAKRHINPAIGSEFIYHANFLKPESLLIALSQSGETIDTLGSVKLAKNQGTTTVGIVNVLGSSLYRLVDEKILLGAGPEKAVASTKSFTAKVAILLLTAKLLAGKLPDGKQELIHAAQAIKAVLAPDYRAKIRRLAVDLKDREHIFVVGRGQSYPAALEAAIKIKEVSYIHAEGLAGGELKHGPIALIEPGTPCIVIAPKDETYGDVLSGAMEMAARGGRIIGISCEPNPIFDDYLPVVNCGDATLIPQVVIAQLLAYELALARGLDPDKPRNLAKSVTVK